MRLCQDGSPLTCLLLLLLLLLCHLLLGLLLLFLLFLHACALQAAGMKTLVAGPCPPLLLAAACGRRSRRQHWQLTVTRSPPLSTSLPPTGISASAHSAKCFLTTIGEDYCGVGHRQAVEGLETPCAGWLECCKGEEVAKRGRMGRPAGAAACQRGGEGLWSRLLQRSDHFRPSNHLNHRALCSEGASIAEMAETSPPPPTRLAFDRTPELLHVQAIRSTKEKVDRVEMHPVQSWLAYVDRNSTVCVWDWERDEARMRRCWEPCRPATMAPNRPPPPAAAIDCACLALLPSPAPPLQLIYDVQLGGADEAALQEAALRQRADRGAAAAGLSAATAAMQEASLAAKGTASGLVRDVKFLDMDSCFWQIARQHWMQYGASDDRTIPYLGESPAGTLRPARVACTGWRGQEGMTRGAAASASACKPVSAPAAAGKCKGLQGKRWLVVACENKVRAAGRLPGQAPPVRCCACLLAMLPAQARLPACCAALRVPKGGAWSDHEALQNTTDGPAAHMYLLYLSPASSSLSCLIPFS